MSDPCREVVRIADEREAECCRLRYDLEQSWADHAKTRAELAATRKLLDECCDAPLKLEIAKQTIAVLRERVRVLEEAARPFAAYARTFHPNWADDLGTDGSNDGTCPTHGDYRRLAAVLAQPPAGGAT